MIRIIVCCFWIVPFSGCVAHFEDLPRPEELPVILRERIPLGAEGDDGEESEEGDLLELSLNGGTGAQEDVASELRSADDAGQSPEGAETELSEVTPAQRGAPGTRDERADPGASGPGVGPDRTGDAPPAG